MAEGRSGFRAKGGPGTPSSSEGFGSSGLGRRMVAVLLFYGVLLQRCMPC